MDVTGLHWTDRPASIRTAIAGSTVVNLPRPQAQAVIPSPSSRPTSRFLCSAPPTRSRSETLDEQRHARRSERRPNWPGRRRQNPKTAARDRYNAQQLPDRPSTVLASRRVSRYGILCNSAYGRHAAPEPSSASEAAKSSWTYPRSNTSQIYAERDLNKAQEIMREIG